MDIDIKDIIYLNDGNKYVVVSKTNYNNKIYYFLVDPTNNSNIKFCEVDNNELVEIENQETIKSLLPLFTITMNKALKEIQE